MSAAFSDFTCAIFNFYFLPDEKKQKPITAEGSLLRDAKVSDAKQHRGEGSGRRVVRVGWWWDGGRDLKDVIYLGLIAC